MIPGYDCPRPTAQNYDHFVEKLTCGLAPLGTTGISLFLYGSYVRGDYIAGRSDIDACIIFPQMVIDKLQMQEVSQILHAALQGNPIQFQVSPLDRATIKDGRFNPYDQEFKKYFQHQGRVIVGPDYRDDFSCTEYKKVLETRVAYRLMQVRQTLLFAQHNLATHYSRFLGQCNTAFDYVSGLPREIALLVEGNLYPERFSSLYFLTTHFSEVDTEPFLRIKRMYKNSQELDALYYHPEEITQLLNSSVTFFEEVVHHFVQRFPYSR